MSERIFTFDAADRTSEFGLRSDGELVQAVAGDRKDMLDWYTDMVNKGDAAAIDAKVAETALFEDIMIEDLPVG